MINGRDRLYAEEKARFVEEQARRASVVAALFSELNLMRRRAERDLAELRVALMSRLFRWKA